MLISRKILSLIVLSVFLLAGSMILTACVITPFQPVTDRNSQLTQGNVQLTLKVGQTSKAQVLEKFGAPNITTRDGQGREVWTYQRAGQASQAAGQANYWTIILFGGNVASSGFESSSRMITLIIKFDKNDRVADFRSRASDF